ncbi:MAG: PQQ-dependent sugar dehydrogenase [Chloroflexi bacterium]|nr:PQQ-dependent sugar dehydrogenase [Chloroflexota bacterium]
MGCGKASPANEPTPTYPSTPGITSPTPTPSLSPLQVEVVADSLEVPWSLAFAPDGRLFFTERPGRIRLVQNGRLLSQPVATLEIAAVGEAGLMGIALDPEFPRNHYLYVYYTYRDPRGNLMNRVARLTESDGQATDLKVILDGIPGGQIHDGGRIKFGPDGKLYITTGDASNSALARNLNSLAGKILRINADGSIPADNPFLGSSVYTWGHRNPQGLAWNPKDGHLFATEHGPVGNDEVNIIVAGQNYGWPQVQGMGDDNRYVNPILVFTPSVAPSGAAFYTGDYVDWQGNLFFTTLRGENIHRVVLTPDGKQVAAHEPLLKDRLGRLRDVVMGPDGFLYVTTSNRDGRGSPAANDDRILRILPGKG